MMKRLTMVATVALITLAMMAVGSLPTFAAPGKSNAGGKELGEEDSACIVGGTSYPTIQSAVNDGNCETILIDEAADGNATIDRDVEISGEDGPAYIFGNEAGSVFTVSAGSTVTLGDLLISKGSAEQGGGIDNAGTLTLTNTFVSESSATNGGGIYNSGTLTLESSGISENEAAQYGGGIYNAGELTLTDFSSVKDNMAGDDGGGIYNQGTLRVCSNSVVESNLVGFMLNNIAGNPPQECTMTSPPPGSSKPKEKGERFMVNHKGKQLCLPEAALKGHEKHGDETNGEPGCSRADRGVDTG